MPGRSSRRWRRSPAFRGSNIRPASRPMGGRLRSRGLAPPGTISISTSKPRRRSPSAPDNRPGAGRFPGVVARWQPHRLHPARHGVPGAGEGRTGKHVDRGRRSGPCLEPGWFASGGLRPDSGERTRRNSPGLGNDRAEAQADHTQRFRHRQVSRLLVEQAGRSRSSARIPPSATFTWLR